MKRLVATLMLAALLGACGGAGAGGATPQPTAPGKTSGPAVAGTEEPKQYPGMTANPNSSPHDYYGN